MPDTPDIPDKPPLADMAAVLAETTATVERGKSPGSTETVNVPETTKEHETMLDVHPAPHAASSSKEFFIHIATIVLGLLIAVALEQTVVYFHHRREVAEVREELRGEREANKNSFTSETTNWRWETAELENNLMVLALSSEASGHAGRKAARQARLVPCFQSPQPGRLGCGQEQWPHQPHAP